MKGAKQRSTVSRETFSFTDSSIECCSCLLDSHWRRAVSLAWLDYEVRRRSSFLKL